MTDTTGLKSDEDLFRIAINRMLLGVRTITPAIVDSEPKKNGRFWVIDAVPSIRRVVRDDEGKKTTKEFPKIPNIPIMSTGSKSQGLSITVPMKVGDECLLLISDRGLDNWQLQEGVQNPPENEEIRHHELIDAVCLPMAGFVENYNNEYISIQSDDGGTALLIKSGEIKSKVGESEMKLTESGLAITSSSLTHNNVNIGSTHTNGGYPIDLPAPPAP